MLQIFERSESAHFSGVYSYAKKIKNKIKTQTCSSKDQQIVYSIQLYSILYAQPYFLK